MEIEEVVKTSPKKKLELFKNAISVGVILSIVWAVFVLAKLESPLQFFNTSEFLYITLILIMLSFVWKILNGAKIVVPIQPNQQQPQQNKVYQQSRETTCVGSWQCPHCNSFVIGEQCRECGYKRNR